MKEPTCLLQVFNARNWMLKATNFSAMLSLSDCPGCSSLRKEVETLILRVESLEAMDQNITIREICRAVEKKICLEAVGGIVGKMKNGFYCFSKFDSQKPTEKAALEVVLTKYQVSEKLIAYLKDEGDITTHDNRNKLTVAILEDALKDGDDDTDQVLAKENFIRALHALHMVGSDGIIVAKTVKKK
jgi:hypothetical protein